MAGIKTRHISAFPIITFTSPAVAAIRNCIINFAATQTGSGTPSPSNIRPIIGRTSTDLYISTTSTAQHTYTMSWNDTLYTGSINYITGTLTATHYLARCQKSAFGNRSSGTSTGTYYRNSSANFPSSASKTSWANARAQQICNMGSIANPYSQASTYGTMIAVVYNSGNANGIMRISQDMYQSLGDDDWVEVLYKLNTPVTYNLTAQQLSTLQGFNRVWSDGDTVELDYDLYETCDMIQLKQRFFIAAPHLITVKSGNTYDSDDIAHFDTNYKGLLKSAKVSFIAQQSGSGIPSPSNVRNFVARSSITLTHAGVNLLSSKNVSNGLSDGVTYTKVLDSNGEVDYITETGTPSWAYYFNNINYEANKMNLLNGRFSFNSYSDRSNVAPVGGVTYTSTDNKTLTSLTYAGAHTYYIYDDNATHNWVRLQGYPYQTSTAVNTTVKPMISLAIDSDEAYQSYKGITYSVTLPVSSYGGTIDFINGTFTDEYDVLTLNTSTMNGSADWPGWNNAGIKYYLGGGLNDNLYNQKLNVGTMFGVNTSGVNDILVLQKSYYNTTIEEWEAKNLDVQILVKKPTPVTYQLTPQAIKAFKGINNLWSKEGKVQLSYWDNQAHNYQKPPIILDNFTYGTLNYKYNENLIADNAFCILGMFDTGYETKKSYSIVAQQPHGNYMRLRMFNDKSAASVDWGVFTSTNVVTWNLSGRYIAVSVYKPILDDFYIYNNTDQYYVYKGKNVT